VCYISVAVAGYLLFGSPVNGNPNPVSGDILSNLPRTTAVTVARVALGLTQVFSFPIVFNSHRANVAGLLPAGWQARVLGAKAGGGGGGGGGGGSDNEVSVRLLAAAPEGIGGALSPWLHDWPHALLTACLVSLAVVVALVVPSLSTILGVKGALGGTVIVYALPAVMNFHLTRRARRGAAAGAKGDGAPGTPAAPSGARRESGFDATPASPLLWGEDSNAPGSEASLRAAAAGAAAQPSLARELLCTAHGGAVLVLVPWALVVMVLGLLATFNVI
jgi:hypothetical protein